MRKVYLVYVGDEWISLTSRQLIGICTTFAHCMKVIREDIKRNNSEKLSSDDRYELENYGRTNERENNYQIEEIEKNVPL